MTAKRAVSFPDLYNLVPAATKKSDLPPAPESGLWAPCWLLGSIIVTVIFLVVSLLLLPFILLFAIGRAIAFSCVKYRRDPKEMRVAVIGGGWSGIQCCARLLELGVKPVCFERCDDLGGTWHPRHRYHGVQIHAPMWVTTFADKSGPVPYSTDTDTNDGKVRGDEMLRFIDKFADQKGLREGPPEAQVLRTNSLVRKVKMDSATEKATLTIEDAKTQVERDEGPFDLVIFHALSTEPSTPTFPGQNDFEGQQFHALDFKAKHFQEIVDKKKKVLVLGGSKTGCDMVLNFVRGGYENYVWAYRKPYQFFKYEALSHDRGCYGMFRGFLLVVALFTSLVSPSIMAMMMWGLGLWCTFGGHPPVIDAFRFHFGVLCSKQREQLLEVPKGNIRAGAGIKKLTKAGVELTTGEHVECDVVLYATGNKTGMEVMEYERDGKPFNMHDDIKCFNHFVVPRFPVLASSSVFITTFGPVRGCNSAELAVYHLCVRQKLTEEYMERKASKLWSVNSPITFFLWSRDIPFARNWLLMHIDCILAGIIPVEAYLRHFLEIFVLNHQTSINLKLLPRQPFSGPTGGLAEMTTKADPLLAEKS